MVVICRRSASVVARLLSRRIASTPTRRMFGVSAAEVELDYESEWEDVYRSPPPPPVVASEKCGEMQGRGVQWVFMGTPNAQKRVYAARVAQLLEVPYISMGTLVRQELHPRSSIYIKEILDQITDIDLVVNFKSAEDCLIKKHFANEICTHCGEPFDMLNSHSKFLNPYLATGANSCKLHTSMKVKIDKSRLEKLQMYFEQNKLLEDYYGKQNKLLNFFVAGGPGETWRGLLAALRLQQVHAASLSNKLTA
ncbi:hypothetical protein HPP92_005095 [Vanilla planifolia]|uniref:Adenylate kinase n=1 Tax=Vanilla planifolia TaxID=51239 RepID=A0A835RSS8_VANPL|nr:hypothetical protein HPP92_005095 [Vanilla planifolia]